MEIRIPGPTKPRYVEKMRFSFLNPSFIPLGIATGLAPLVTAVGVVMLPLGRPVWNTFVILMCRGDILAAIQHVGRNEDSRCCVVELFTWSQCSECPNGML